MTTITTLVYYSATHTTLFFIYFIYPWTAVNIPICVQRYLFDIPYFCPKVFSFSSSRIQIYKGTRSTIILYTQNTRASSLHFFSPVFDVQHFIPAHWLEILSVQYGHFKGIHFQFIPSNNLSLFKITHFLLGWENQYCTRVCCKSFKPWIFCPS